MIMYYLNPKGCNKSLSRSLSLSVCLMISITQKQMENGLSGWTPLICCVTGEFLYLMSPTCSRICLLNSLMVFPMYNHGQPQVPRKTTPQVLQFSKSLATYFCTVPGLENCFMVRIYLQALQFPHLKVSLICLCSHVPSLFGGT